MILAMLLCGALLTGTPVDDPPVKTPELEAYAAAKAKAPRTPDAQVKLALWCEAHGLSAERTKHLMLATLLDPANTLARGLMGLVSYQGKWLPPADIARQVQEDPSRKALLKDYLQLRAKKSDKPDDQWKLALWCEEKGLKEQATAHLYQVLKRDPRREAAWKRLGFKKIGGRWVKPEMLAAEKAEAQTQARATKFWQPRLEKWRDGLGGRDKAKKVAVEDALNQITDPRAVPAVMMVFGHSNESQQKIALRILGQIDSQGSSRALAMLAVFSGSAIIRGQATEIVRRRDVREFADFLISLIQQPIQFEVKRVKGPGSSGELLIKGQGSKPNLKRVYSPPAAPSVPIQLGDQLVYDASGAPVIQRPLLDQRFTVWIPGHSIIDLRNGPLGADQKQRVIAMLEQSGLGSRAQQLGQQLISGYENQWNPTSLSFFLAAWQAGSLNTPIIPSTQFGFTFGNYVQIPVGQMGAEAQRTSMAAQQQLDRDAQSIRDYNNSLRELNDRVLPVLQNVSGLDLGTERQKWENWFIDQIGYQSPPSEPSEPDTVVQDVPLDYQPEPVPVSQFVDVVAIQRISCFGPGTLVHTLSGPRSIQDIAIGDRILTQNVKTGALDYQPVLVVHHNPPSRTFKVTLGDEVIVSSFFHRFWKAGQGWVMARDLALGDSIRTLNGTVKVAKIEEGKVVPVFNLDIAGDADFFVGRSIALVHDNSLPDLRQPPFDGVLAAAVESDSKAASGTSRSTGSLRP